MAVENAEIIKNRQIALGDLLRKEGLDALILNPGPSLTYMTGLHFHLSERPVVCIFTPDRAPVLVLPELETAKLIGLPYELVHFYYTEETDKWILAYQDAAKAAGLGNSKVGVEDISMRLLEMKYLKEVLPAAEFLNSEKSVSKLRLNKNTVERENIQKAADIAQAALEFCLPKIKIGMTEKEFASELVIQLYRHGSDPDLPFSPIVSSGPNSADPHAFPSDRKFGEGELLVIDWGASKNGYFSDITRTFAIGEPNAEQIKIHQTVLDANQAGHATAKPGITCGEVDTAARTIIDNAGYGEYFITRTGHGLGMEVHEEPYIRSENPMILEPGMCFTIEPGIYIAGQDGVRIEDDVIVTETGIHSYTSMDRSLRVVGK
ncbi:MAG: aminopeptidase P family protein [Chloroflexi bacterium]|nr:aminopeptidase P family protein [Chloroflexota bacterium]